MFMVFSMSRLVCLSIAVALALLSVAAQAAPVQKKPKPVWHGYGFLPGYQQPLSNSQPVFAQKDGLRRLARQNRRPWYIDPTPRYYGWDGELHYPGRARLLQRPLQWRHLWSVLDADADRPGLELRLIGRLTRAPQTDGADSAATKSENDRPATL
jgi:hypothetical protein